MQCSCETIPNDGAGVTIRMKEGWQAGSGCLNPFLSLESGLLPDIPIIPERPLGFCIRDIAVGLKTGIATLNQAKPSPEIFIGSCAAITRGKSEWIQLVWSEKR